ncbi:MULTISPECIES: ATP-dependent protease LonB [Methanosarcina]|jgi:Lon-like ATP-dependent protease|uniref:Archaeal Lon protease n=3 Tax=Methanosarcina mazei TaxID=2209 RepID=A0A0F8R9G9_METMZ|nr:MULTISPECIES: ATP-dependent protease LonB [Methanosarcina]AKB40165.1 ATP-dependent protease La Type I [Methanosarcina mazei WWM610]KKG01807.1 ATP-dependent protease Lon [Methanosarcina mazei]KKG05604.1 ATP-dependent protease Lon [Methanosarcina mazei]KKG06168.1 ATP-dependent protease Lon [Methanosarcina mazei]KKG15496.1 ATP-dependent protease Lon [Methanosarcina mazei]
MVYNNNQNIDGSSENMDRQAHKMEEPVPKVDPSAADQTKDEPNKVMAESELHEDIDEDVDIGFQFEDTSNIEVPKLLIDQVLGQEHAVEVVRKAASQRRHIMMIGTPGTGKSLLAKAMAELLPKEELKDILVYPNLEDLNNPKIREVPAGKGREIVMAHKMEARKKAQARNMLMMLFVVGIIIYSYFVSQLLWGIIAGIMILMLTRQFLPKEEMMIPKMAVSNYDKEHAPYIDATGAHAGALLGDVRHDPFQSGGLETPAHDRVEAGDIHKAHKGVLFIDEINTLRLESQQSLLTALQEKEYPITGQSERSSGALVKTEPVPCDFIMVSAGNLDAVQKMHPALRSRIKGYGYEVYMRDSMEDTHENRKKLVRFVAQEVMRDGHIPHFDEGAVEEVIREARRRAGRKGHLTLKLRDLGGLVRVAGDIAHSEGAPLTTSEHVLAAKRIARSIEQQLADSYLEQRKEYESFLRKGSAVGRVNGLAVMGGDSGIVLPIVSEVTPALSGAEGRIIATGKLKTIAKEAVQNVSAVIKNMTGTDVSRHDVHIQFVGTYEGVEGDSASVSIATAVISAIEKIPVDQTVAMTGSLSVRGDVLPVGGVTYKIEAAAQAGMKKVIIPKANEADVLVEKAYREKIQIIPVSSIAEVMEHSLVGPRKNTIIEKLKNITKLSFDIPEVSPASVQAINLFGCRN